jgi:hypothetical protein
MTREQRARHKRWWKWWKRLDPNGRALFAVQEAIEETVHGEECARDEGEGTEATIETAVGSELVRLRELLGGYDRAMDVCKESRQTLEEVKA